jgi:ubiquinone/menaquinone biosynthesis C-methylase UbiE
MDKNIETYLIIDNRNFHAPIEEDLKKGINVLDSGCGPGTWTLEMAETYKESKFYGVDASSIFPDTTKPANADFVVANLAKSLPFPENHFDFIFQRLLIFGLRDEDWTNVRLKLLLKQLD